MAFVGGLTACGQVPKPFQPDVKSNSNPLLVLGDGAGVVVLPFAGLDTLSDGEVFAVEMAEELLRQNVPASTGEGGNLASLFLSGRVSFQPPGLRGAAPPRLSVLWELVSKDGGVVADLQDDVVYDPTRWARLGTRAVARETARRTAPRIAAILQTQVVEAPTALPDLADRVRVRIDPVEGAPGDGNRSLTIAMKAALRRAGVIMVQDLAEATMVVAGRVDAKPVLGDKEEIAISWTVSDAARREIGTISQANVIARGSLSGAWGEVARIVADGAVDGLLDLVDRAEARADASVVQ